MAEITEEKVKELCRDVIEKEELVSRPFCKLRHEVLEKEVGDMRKDNVKRDEKLDSIHRLAYGIMCGIIVTLAIQVINMLGRPQ